MDQRELRDAESSLVVIPVLGRLRDALARGTRLRETIAKKRRSLRADEERLGDVGRRVERTVLPLVEQCERLDAELQALFAELLAPKRLGASAHRRVRFVYDDLQEQGMLTSRAAEEDDGEAVLDDPGERDSPAATSRPDASASVRDTFLRLARRLHPDAAGGASDQLSDLMKEVNAAYARGDVARLLEVERGLAAGQVMPDDDEARLARLLEANRGLEAQLVALDRDLRALRASEPMKQLKAAKRRGVDLVEEMAAFGADAVADLERMKSFVIAFRDGRMPLDEFLAGPPPAEP